jgi:fumarate reductase subunit D
MTTSHLQRRASVLWLAALVHRLSGLALALFLPLHFLTLGLAL